MRATNGEGERKTLCSIYVQYIYTLAGIIPRGVSSNTSLRNGRYCAWSRNRKRTPAPPPQASITLAQGKELEQRGCYVLFFDISFRRSFRAFRSVGRSAAKTMRPSTIPPPFLTFLPPTFLLPYKGRGGVPTFRRFRPRSCAGEERSREEGNP